MAQWNSTAEACSKEETWSTCFLRRAYGSAGYDCSQLGSLNCTAPTFGGPVTDPHVFYGAYNIYSKWILPHIYAPKPVSADWVPPSPAVNTLFSNWSDALYALKSQTALAELVLALSGPGLPRLTPSSLLSAVISHYGLNAAADEALLDILPVDLTLLDTEVTFYSTQLSSLLAGLLENVMGEKGKFGFMFLARKGQMMADTEEDVERLMASLAGSLVTGLQTEASGG